MWLILYGLAYLLALWQLALAVDRTLRPAFIGYAALLSVVSRPLAFHVMQGQADLLTAALSTLAFLAYARDRRLLSAALLAAATAIKLNPAFLLLYFVVYQRDYRYLARFLAAFSLLAGASLVVVPLALWSEYGRDVLPSIAGGFDSLYVQSLSAGLSTLVQPQLCAAVGTAGLALWLYRQGPPRDRSLGASNRVFLLCVLALLLLSPATWSMAYVWVILPSALLVVDGIGTLPVRALPLLAGALALLSADLYDVPVVRRANLYGAVALATLLLVFRTRRSEALARREALR